MGFNDLLQIEWVVGSITPDSIKRRLYPNVKEAFLTLFNDTKTDFGFGRIMPDPLAITDIENRIIVLSQKTTDRLKGDLRYQILEGMRNNEGVDTVSQRIKEVFGKDTVNTERIARNEIITSSKAGRNEAYTAAGVWGREWMSVKGSRTCDICKTLDGQVAPMGEWFKHPDTGEDLIGDMAHIQCRCSTKPLMNEPNDYVVQKGVNRVWIKPTSKRKGHWRRIKGSVVDNKPKTKIDNLHDIEHDIKTYEHEGNLLKHELAEFVNNYENLSPKDKSKMIKIKRDMDNAYSFQMKSVVDWQNKQDNQDNLYNDYNSDIVISNIQHTEHSMTKGNVDKIVPLGDIPNVTQGINAEKTNIVIFEDKSKGIYKPTQESSIIGEVGAYRTSQIIGWDIVPETVSVDLGKGVGSCQKWVEGVEELEYDGGYITNINMDHMSDLSKIFIIDMLLGASDDRHIGNIAVKGDRVYMIDNEVFGRYDTVDSGMEALNEYMEDNERGGGGSRQISWMKTIDNRLEFESEEDEQDYYEFGYNGDPNHIEFYNNIKNNINVALKHKEEIMVYYENQPDITTPFSPTKISEAVERIRDNFDKLESYGNNMELI